MSPFEVAGDSEDRVAAAAQRRRAERSERSAARQNVTMVGLLSGAADRGIEVTLELVDGSARRFRPLDVSDAAVVGASPSGRVEVVVMDAVASVTLGGSASTEFAGDVDAERSLRPLSELLGRWLTIGGTIGCRSGALSVTGTLATIGADVLAVTTTDGGTRYLRVDSLTEVWTSDSSYC